MHNKNVTILQLSATQIIHYIILVYAPLVCPYTRIAELVVYLAPSSFTHNQALFLVQALWYTCRTLGAGALATTEKYKGRERQENILAPVGKGHINLL